MIKMIALVKKRSDLSHAEFERYWLAEHTTLSAVIGMRRYTINVRIPDPPTPSTAGYDGTAEIWWDDFETMRRCMASPEGVLAARDTANFAESVTFVYTAEHEVPLPT